MIAARTVVFRPQRPPNREQWLSKDTFQAPQVAQSPADVGVRSDMKFMAKASELIGIALPGKTAQPSRQEAMN